MDSDTATESDLSLKPTFIPEQSEWPIAKDAEPFSRRFNARHWQTFFDLVNVYVFDIGSIRVHGKELPSLQKWLQIWRVAVWLFSNKFKTVMSVISPGVDFSELI